MPRDVLIRGEMIRLGQLLKLAGLVGGGGEVRGFLAEATVLVNGEPEARRGRQLVPGDLVQVNDLALRVARRQATHMTPKEDPAPTVADNPGASRFELHLDAELVGFAEYLPAGDSVIISHTEIAEGHEGEGLGGVLVRAALEQIRASGKTVIPTCPFTAAYIRRHPEFVELVASQLRDQFRQSN